MEESPGTGSEAHPAPEAKPETAGTGGNSAGSANPQKQAKEVLVDEKEAQKLREENERLKAESQTKDLALSEAANRQREAARERLKAAMDGKVPKGLQGKVLELSGAIDEGKSIELSDEAAPGGKRKTTGMELLVEIVSALPRPVEPGALSLSDSPGQADTSGKPDAADRKKMLAAI